MASPEIIQMERSFPFLRREGYQITSSLDEAYNCFAWAANDDSRWWEPHGGFWPSGVPREDTMDAYVEAFGTLGYIKCGSEDYEVGFEKIVLFAKEDGSPKHAARQLGTRHWTSKLGRGYDLTHTLGGLAGTAYGDPKVFMKRPVHK